MNKRINPNLRKLAELTHNLDLEVDKSIFEKQTSFQPTVPERKGMIYVPSIGIYVAKERSLCGKNWYDTHKALDKQGLFMPTIPQFIEFIKYLRNGYSDNEEAYAILDESLTIRSPWRAEWLDAKFEKQGKEFYIHYNHVLDSQGNLASQQTEKLDVCLMKDRTPGIDLGAWLNNPTKHGLPKSDIKKGDLYYWYPRANCVARFDAGSDRAVLDCIRDPSYSFASLGVYGCCEAARAENLKSS